MTNWYDTIERMTIKTTIRLEDGRTKPGPAFTDPSTLENISHRCGEKGCSGTRFVPHVVNTVISMVRKELTHQVVTSYCDGTKWRIPSDETDQAMFHCGNTASYDISITYKPKP